MYEKVIIALLLSGFIAPTTQQNLNATSEHTPASPPPATVGTTTKESPVTTDKPALPGQREERKQMEHTFSEAVIIPIILLVIAAFDGIILLIYFLACQLRKKSSLDVQPSSSHAAGIQLSSVETGNPDKTD
ncbi:glycophorin-A-like [Nycticebus coucang]|uniref:glycophorin-A-like n=1 Tax=Nycticebus coucang TaxID=9470 RepID=UPI00234CC660|nr:glycophorin-A-like [Nycticebus coucang]